MPRFARLHIHCDNDGCMALHKKYLPTYRIFPLEFYGYSLEGHSLFQADNNALIDIELKREGWLVTDDKYLCPECAKVN